MSLSRIEESVPDRRLAVWWLGQAGFAFKTSENRVVYLDPYLSDAVERLFGFKRLSLAPIAAEEVRADLVVLTHEHADHLDPDALPAVARNNPACRFAAPAGCLPGLDEAGVPRASVTVLEPHGHYDVCGVGIGTVPADHGDLSETALALVLEMGGIRVACTGDTAYRPALLKPLGEPRPEILLPCINGAFGNMTHVDAARLVEQVCPKMAIPCHFWTFAEQGVGDPGGFLAACRQFCPEVTTAVLKPGQRFLYEGDASCR